MRCLVASVAMTLTWPAFASAQAPPAFELVPATASATDETPVLTAPSTASQHGDTLTRSPFADLFTSTLSDFRRLPSRDTLMWLGIGATTAALTHLSDRTFTDGLSQSAFFGETLKAGQLLGSAGVQHGSAFATYMIGRLTNKPRVALVGADLVQAQLIAQVLTEGVKKGVGRTRPDGTSYSFPSGHASVTFATATVLQRDLGWKVGIPAYGLATYVAASRIQTKRHFLSDVAFGAAIGIVAGRTVTVGRGDSRFAVSPMAVPGGGGVSFAWLGSR
jgi:membrane-associated phospholipid phosphatase